MRGKWWPTIEAAICLLPKLPDCPRMTPSVERNELKNGEPTLDCREESDNPGHGTTTGIWRGKKLISFGAKHAPINAAAAAAVAHSYLNFNFCISCFARLVGFCGKKSANDIWWHVVSFHFVGTSIPFHREVQRPMNKLLLCLSFTHIQAHMSFAVSYWLSQISAILLL